MVHPRTALDDRTDGVTTWSIILLASFGRPSAWQSRDNVTQPRKSLLISTCDESVISCFQSIWFTRKTTAVYWPLRSGWKARRLGGSIKNLLWKWARRDWPSAPGNGRTSMSGGNEANTPGKSSPSWRHRWTGRQELDRATEDAQDRRRARDTGHGHAGGVGELHYATALPGDALVPPAR